jgi:RHS repeat-associated protein
LTDETQKTTDTYTYDAFGKILSSTGNTVNDFLFTGEQYDANVGFYYLRARYMDPSVGRFVTADPFGGFMFEPLSLHKYLYANADPVNNIDPSGYFSLKGLVTSMSIQSKLSSTAFSCIAKSILRNAVRGLVRGMLFGGVDAWLGGGTVEDIVNGIISGGITGAILGPLAMVNRLRPLFIAFGLGSGVKGVYDSIKNKEYDQAAFRAIFVIHTLWGLKKGLWDKKACFTEETLVLTADGYRQIKDIQEGDLVYSENVETGEKGLKRVSKVFVREIKKLVHVYVDGEEIKTTDTHPFWVEGKGWIEAGELAGGDVLRLYTGELKIVDKVEIEVFDKAVKVYNFEVEDWHTYYVSDEAVLVHNAKNYNQKGNKGGKGNNSGKGNTSKGTNTNKAAEDLGYTKTNYRSHGQPVYKNGNKYITPDVDGHNGGAWKMADSIKNLGSKSTRMGTYDANLNRIGD